MASGELSGGYCVQFKVGSFFMGLKFGVVILLNASGQR